MSYRFIGRRREFAAAAEALRAAATGDGGVLAICGPAGIGKSRLAREVATNARSQGMAVVWSAGWPGPGATPYWPWPRVVAAIDPAVAAALDVPPEALESERFARFQSVATCLVNGAAMRPLVIVLDDAHLIEPDGLLLTRFIARMAPGHRLLLLITHRIGIDVAVPLASILDDIGREGLTVRLRGLRTDEVSELLVARGETWNDALLRRVCELTDGNPFLVEQVLDAGLDQRDRLLSEPVRRVLDGPLEMLDGPAIAVLQAAAVLGPRTTVKEIMAVAEVAEVQIEAARKAAFAASIIRSEAGAPFAFTHELFREAVLSRMAPARLAEVHRRCLRVIDELAPSSEDALRRARHALALAGGANEESATALAIVRVCAQMLLENGSPEAAVGLLKDACAGYQTAGMAVTPQLQAELGRALLATGRLAEARPAFERAVAGAEVDRDPVTFAVGALGLGGVWLHEHRGEEASRRYNDVLQRAIDGLKETRSPHTAELMASLLVRQAAERAVVGEASIADVESHVDALRSLSRPAALAAGLSLLHHTMLGPEHSTRRPAIASEMTEAARIAGDELLTAMGLMWQTVDLLLLGKDADREIDALRSRADALNMQAILFVLDAIGVMRLMRAGELAKAEAAAEACLQRGLEVGDADATTYYGAHRLALAWYRGVTAPVLDLAQQLASEPSTPVDNPVFLAVATALAAAAGDRDRAVRNLEIIGKGRLKNLPSHSSWLLALTALVEAALALDDADLAREVYPLLEPYAALPVMGSLAICCFGSTERSLGLAARVMGRLDDAIVHLERAEQADQRWGNWPLTAITRAYLAMALHARGRRDDLDRALALINSAIQSAERMQLDGRVEGYRRLAHAWRNAAAPSPAVCTKNGLTWEISLAGERATVPHMVGMEYLAALLAAPGTSISAARLAGADIESVPYEVLDQTAMNQLRRTIRELEASISASERAGDRDRAEHLERELEQLTAHLRRSTARHGRSRQFDDTTERARTSVQKAIRRAIATIETRSPRMAGMLRESIQTGYECRFVLLA